MSKQTGQRGKARLWKLPPNLAPHSIYRSAKVRTAYSELADEIILQAVRDWRILIRQGAPNYGGKMYAAGNFDELRSFFTGEWAAFLMQEYDEDLPLRMLAMLENELAEAERPKRKGSVLK